MASVDILSYKVQNDVVTINTIVDHGLSAGSYISIRNVASNVNGQYFVASTPNAQSFTYEVSGVSDVAITTLSGAYFIYTSFNNSGKPAYIYDESGDVWYQISAKVNTSGNYTWTGTHLHQAPVTMEDITILKNLSASPSASPSGGGYLYVENGELKFMGGNGTITTIAPA